LYVLFSVTKIRQNTHRMQQKVQTYIEKHQLLVPDKPVVVGVSGGTDSVVLLHILMSLGYECVIAHCNFHLRMEESDRDESFVRELANGLKIQSYFIDFETTEHASKHGISIEMAARDLRYAWFNELLVKINAQAIAVAHHADDSIETLLMNLVRGTGLKGLTGIPARNENVVRPLLCLTRSEIETYLVRYDLDHVEDSTNGSSDYQRNKFRNEILPLLEEINPSVRQTLYNSLQHFEGNLAVYQQAIHQIENEIVYIDSDSIKLDIDLLKKQIHIPTVLFELLHPYGFSNAVIEQITANLDGESGKMFFSDSYRLVKDRKYLILNEIKSVQKEKFRITENQKEIDQPFHLKITRKNITSEFIPSKKPDCIQVDASKLTFPLLLRKWEEGDAFYPFGMTQRKKVSDFFVNNKLSLLEKEQSWILISGEDIVWIVCQRLDNRFRVNEKTKMIVEFRLV